MLEIRDLSYSYSTSPILKGTNLTIQAGEIVCLLGPSGSGKTTLLRLIAGLEQEYSGQIRFDGVLLRDIPVHQRRFGLMFQDYALFPHMNVSDNIGFGMKMQGTKSKERTKEIEDVLQRVGLAQYAQRDVGALSGGERQRVALARSLAPQPRFLMLDEPLGSLDAALRERLALELRQLIKTQKLTALYVTHDQQEAYAIADRIGVMQGGQITRIDSPENLYRKPGSLFVARFLGLGNTISFTVRNKSWLSNVLEYEASPEYGEDHALLIHPDAFRLDSGSPLRAIVENRVFRGDYYQVRLSIADAPPDIPELVAHLPSAGTLIHEGMSVHLRIDTRQTAILNN